MSSPYKRDSDPVLGLVSEPHYVKMQLPTLQEVPQRLLDLERVVETHRHNCRVADDKAERADNEEFKDICDRLAKIEKWMWLHQGMFVVIGAVAYALFQKVFKL